MKVNHHNGSIYYRKNQRKGERQEKRLRWKEGRKRNKIQSQRNTQSIGNKGKKERILRNI